MGGYTRTGKVGFQCRLEPEFYEAIKAEAIRRRVSTNRVFNELISDALKGSVIERRLESIESALNEIMGRPA